MSIYRDKDWHIPNPIPMIEERWVDEDGVARHRYSAEYLEQIKDRKVREGKDGKNYVTDSWHRDHAYSHGYKAGWLGHMIDPHMYCKGWEINRECYEQGYEDGKGDRRLAWKDIDGLEM